MNNIKYIGLIVLQIIAGFSVAFLGLGAGFDPNNQAIQVKVVIAIIVSVILAIMGGYISIKKPNNKTSTGTIILRIFLFIISIFSIIFYLYSFLLEDYL